MEYSGIVRNLLSFINNTFLHEMYYSLSLLHRISECDDGWYGAGCSKPCHCAGSEVCEKVTGMCANGCPNARFGDGCPFSKH